MNAIETVKFMTSTIESQKNCLNLAIDRGLGKGMKIEKWILIEMLAKLVELRNQGYLENVESEHNYSIKKTTRFERCDLWWTDNNCQHWLEVKTIVISKDQQRGSLEDVFKDLDKRNRLNQTDIFHHLSIVFPLNSIDVNAWKNQLDSLYKENGLIYESDWNKEICDEQFLLMVLYKQV